MDKQPKLPPMPGGGLNSFKPDHFAIVNEGMPGPMLSEHPGLVASKFRPASRDDAGTLYRAIFGIDPPATAEEHAAGLEERRRARAAWRKMMKLD